MLQPQTDKRSKPNALKEMFGRPRRTRTAHGGPWNSMRLFIGHGLVDWNCLVVRVYLVVTVGNCAESFIFSKDRANHAIAPVVWKSSSATLCTFYRNVLSADFPPFDCGTLLMVYRDNEHFGVQHSVEDEYATIDLGVAEDTFPRHGRDDAPVEFKAGQDRTSTSPISTIRFTAYLSDRDPIHLGGHGYLWILLWFANNIALTLMNKSLFVFFGRQVAGDLMNPHTSQNFDSQSLCQPCT